MKPFAYDEGGGILCPACAGQQPATAIIEGRDEAWCSGIAVEAKVHVRYCAVCREPTDLHESRRCPNATGAPGGPSGSGRSAPS